ncbi:uncharacterized protein LOC116014720 [Ipomoea triloba]|uniref:uncharacterized protein LOC116014720 n=1 Tax=Ipomoea triloba TaxID=35885 RepID=UPI00125D3F61|nr:uncharacterized protein LOC116014720 [Ipomoea triloba]
MVYVLDLMPCDRDLEIKLTLNVVFRSSTNMKGQRAKNWVNWRIIECPKQSGSVECGYYVLRYMYEICTLYYEFEDLERAFARSKPYTKNEIDGIREIWAKYFCEECL